MSTIIGITPSFTDDRKYSLNLKYVSGLDIYGITPLILPYEPDSIQTYLRLVSGVLISGGGDIDARYFGQLRHEKAGEPTIARDEFELALCRAAIAADIPLLGICRGAQVLNVALGGDLCQHIEGHNYSDRRSDYIHNVEIAIGSKLYSIVGRAELKVNSIHHQCAGEKLGEGVSVSAVSPDGIIEAIEVASNKFAVGVQWHPEELAAFDSNHASLFHAFVNAAKI